VVLPTYFHPKKHDHPTSYRPSAITIDGYASRNKNNNLENRQRKCIKNLKNIENPMKIEPN